jgi:ribosome recycling factor
MISMVLEEGNPKKLETPCKQEMDKAIVHFEKELTAIRTGKAHTSLVDTLKVEAYGSTMQLKELASVAAPDTNIITVQPWDQSVIGDIEKAIATSHLGVNPQVDGHLIRITLPQMTAARREELIKLVGKKAEDAKVAIRNVRKDVLNVIRDSEKKSKTISEDFSKRLSKLLQDITDQYVTQIVALSDKKQGNLKSF